MIDIEAVDLFLAEPRNAIVAGVRSDGRPHLTPNWFLWRDGRFYLSTTKARAKYRIFRQDPRVQLVVDDATGFRYVAVGGTVRVDDNVDAGFEYFRDLRHKHGRFESDERELRAEMIRDDRVTLVVTPDKPQQDWLHLGFSIRSDSIGVVQNEEDGAALGGGSHRGRPE